jgi:SAM-dependent methyltransferase
MNNTSIPHIQSNTNFITRIGNLLSLEIVASLLPSDKKNVTLLDVGCGYNAQLLRYLMQKDMISGGLGIDSAVDDHCRISMRQRLPGGGGLTFLEGDIMQLVPELKQCHFDIVTCINVLEHVWNPQDLLHDMTNCLKDDGILIIQCPTWLDKLVLELIHFQIFPQWENSREQVDDHKMYYAKRDLWPMLVRAGFKPSKIRSWYKKFGLVVVMAAKK